MKPQIAIITHSFLNAREPGKINTGGVERWILELLRLFRDLGLVSVVYQTSVKDFSQTYEGSEIIGIGGLNRMKMSRLSHDDIDRRGIRRIIYASSFAGKKYFRSGNVFIQHGIHWDYDASLKNPLNFLKWEFVRRNLSRKDLRMARKSILTITVDTNFLNYNHAMHGQNLDDKKVNYIPNFAVPRDPSEWQAKWRDPDEILIVFPRRFEFRRGVTIFSNAIEQVLMSSSKISVKFAGCGSYDSFLSGKFGKSGQVSIENLTHEKMLELLKRAHIAVIPSIYSEGTSFSCLEAMASGCAVVATAVGGLGNIVLPDYNGLLIRPTASEIGLAVTKLAGDLQLSETLAFRGYDTICHSFSLAHWRKRVEMALSDVGII